MRSATSADARFGPRLQGFHFHHDVWKPLAGVLHEARHVRETHRMVDANVVHVEQANATLQGSRVRRWDAY